MRTAERTKNDTIEAIPRSYSRKLELNSRLSNTSNRASLSANSKELITHGVGSEDAGLDLNNDNVVRRRIKQNERISLKKVGMGATEYPTSTGKAMARKLKIRKIIKNGAKSPACI
jgi:hypothetical protein